MLTLGVEGAAVNTSENVPVRNLRTRGSARAPLGRCNVTFASPARRRGIGSWKLTDAAGEYGATSEFGLPRGLCSFQFTDLFVRKQTENRILHSKCSEDSGPEAERARSKEPQRKGSKNKGIL